jgi:hypothetical protein
MGVLCRCHSPRRTWTGSLGRARTWSPRSWNASVTAATRRHDDPNSLEHRNIAVARANQRQNSRHRVVPGVGVERRNFPHDRD